MKVESRNEYEKNIIVKVSIWTMILNALLAVMKIITGIIGKSSAIISDAVNSISDVVTAVAVMIIGRFSRKDRDIDHPYGHEKYESLASVFLGVALLLTAFEIGKNGIITLYDFLRFGTPIQAPNIVALIAGVLTIVIKECMYQYTIHNAKKANSASLIAMSYDHRSDELTALGVIIGIAGSMWLGLTFLEPIASVVVCVLIFVEGIKVIGTGVSQVVDQAADKTVEEQVRSIVASQKGILHLDDLKTRLSGMRLFVDIEIAVDPKLTIYEAHHYAQVLHDEIESQMPDVIHCMIHVNPYKKTENDRL
jgi:cation diffusion facilitator family transporter